MFWAQLSGKLSVDDERAEDLLTSNVFGTLKYVPLAAGLAPVLEHVRGSAAAELRRYLEQLTSVEVTFWPWVEEYPDRGCEPDVVLAMSTGETRALVFIEAKYLSGKSSFADPSADPGDLPRDQLAKEWISCERRARKAGAQPFLLYLTADYAMPAAEIRDSQNDLLRGGFGPGTILWLSWHRVAAALPDTHALSRDLKQLLSMRYGFRSFDGITSSAAPLSWRLPLVERQHAAASANWSVGPFSRLSWRFVTGPATLDWRFPPLTWRFGFER